MKRTFAVVTLLASLGVLIKLASKPIALDRVADRTIEAPAAPSGPGAGSSASAAGADSSAMLARYRTASPRVREMVARLAERFGRNAAAIDRTDGERGLVLLDKLDMEALVLYEKYPVEFHRLRDVLGADAAADVLLHWREYFGLKRGDETDRSILIAELSSLSPPQRRAAARYPAALPLILAEPQGVTALIERLRDDRAALGDALDGPRLHQPRPRGVGPAVGPADLRALRPAGAGGVPPPGSRGLRPGQPVRTGPGSGGGCLADGSGADPCLGQCRLSG